MSATQGKTIGSAGLEPLAGARKATVKIQSNRPLRILPLIQNNYYLIYFSILRFVKNPEFLKVGQKLVFREGRTKAVGKLIKS